jgi:type III pantothenate kinase
LVSDPIYLLVDAGNTRIKWGLLDGTGIVKTGAIPTADAALLHGEWGGTVAPKHMVASNVAGDSVEAHLEHTCENAGMTLRMVRSEAEQLGVVNGYRDPAQLGSDRWAALIAAHHGGKGHKLVVNVGTALTIDALAEGGRFLGGLIVPGPALMRRSLDRGTAGLRLTEGALHDFPESTPDAITSGAIQACVGAIVRMHGVMTAQGMAPRQVILSGGAAAELAPHLPLSPTLRENLVLEGLALVARAS